MGCTFRKMSRSDHRSPTKGQSVCAVIWDFGNVLVQWDRRFLYDRLIPDSITRDRFLSEVTNMKWNERFDRGEPLDQLIEETILRHPEWDAGLIRAYDERWVETLGPLMGASIDLLGLVSVPSYGLSNFARTTFDRVSHRFTFLEHLKDFVLSGDVGLTKPDPAIFHLLIERTGIESHTSLFIDDNAANIAAAASLGFATHHFLGAEGLARELAQLGLLSATPEG